MNMCVRFTFEVIHHSDVNSSLLRCYTVCNGKETPTRLGMSDPEDGDITLLRNVSEYLPIDLLTYSMEQSPS